MAVAARVVKTMTARIVRAESTDYGRDLSSLQNAESFPIEAEATDVLFHDGPFEEISVERLRTGVLNYALGSGVVNPESRDVPPPGHECLG
jgi:hypothetical protein